VSRTDRVAEVVGVPPQRLFAQRQPHVDLPPRCGCRRCSRGTATRPHRRSGGTRRWPAPRRADPGRCPTRTRRASPRRRTPHQRRHRPQTARAGGRCAFCTRACPAIGSGTAAIGKFICMIVTTRLMRNAPFWSIFAGASTSPGSPMEGPPCGRRWLSTNQDRPLGRRLPDTEVGTRPLM